MSNRLSNEKSPYLLQHKDNPVHWYSWGNEAFSKAKNEDKPIFLSIGYSTCHWCHVMAHESFEDKGVADVLNADFVAVKVDREERPDVDSVYMSACLAMTGSGGWPLSVLITPEGKPFWCGTYLPKEQFTALLERASQLWKTQRSSLSDFADRLTEHLNKSQSGRPSAPDKAIIRKAVTGLASVFDGENGGFGSAPKFPVPHDLIFLMRYSHLAKDPAGLKMAEKTLEQMFRGGIFDHIGGGFARYSTDKLWLVPHFEKMLYDNALLIFAYAEAWLYTQKDVYKNTAQRTIEYAFRELMSEKGGFFCGQDADSEGVEGKYYVFTPDELRSVLAEDEYRTFADFYGITERGNFEGKNIPNLLKNESWQKEPESMAKIRQKLMDYRKSRTALHRDSKILTSWNGLMMAALARAGAIFGIDSYIDRAKGIYNFICSNLMCENGRLLAAFTDGKAYNEGKQEDYAFCIWGLLELFDATFDGEYLIEAQRLSDILLEYFFDSDKGGIFPYAHDGEQLITRGKDTHDGAIPSANSVAGLIFSRLSRLTGRQKWKDACGKQLSFLSGAAEEQALGHSFAMLALSEHLYEPKELICAVSNMTEELKSFLHRQPHPNLSVLVKTRENAETLAAAAPFTKDYAVSDRHPLYYLCKNHTCVFPISSLNELDI